MSLSRKMKYWMLQYRSLTTLLVWLALVVIGGLATTVIGYQQRHEQAQLAARQAITHIERLLDAAQHTNQQVADLVGQPCEDVLPALRTAATQAAFVHTLKLVQQQAVYCSSLMADVNNPTSTLRRNDYVVGMITLQPGSASRPDHPLLSLRTPVPQGAVISNIDSTHLTTLLSLSLPLPPSQVWLRIGDRWLEGTGQLHHGLPPQVHNAQVNSKSATYPLAVALYYTTDLATWLGWAQQWRLTWLLWLVISLAATAALWRGLGQAHPLERELTQGLARQEFVPYVQPVFHAQSRQLCGLEVLMRWQHPQLGIVEPLQFIPSAEASGLIVPMTSQLMAQVAQQLAPHAALLPTPFHVAVNISPAHFTSTTLLQDCREFLASFPINQVVLSLELTEREWLCNNPQTQAICNELWLLGVQLALDDFGTGHSSLAYLKQFPIDIIKLDQMFVRKLGLEKISEHVVDHVITLGHKLGLLIIAEGVETDYQANYLTLRGVDQLQGYLFGQPLPLLAWLGGLCCNTPSSCLFDGSQVQR